MTVDSEHNDAILVCHGELSSNGDEVTCSAEIDGAGLSYCFPAASRVQLRGELFLAVALLHAMAAGRALVFTGELPLDSKLVGNLPIIQRLLKQWNPHLTLVEIRCAQLDVCGSDDVLSSFSGGVDSSFTLWDHLQEIDKLLTVDSFDSGLHTDQFDALAAKVRKTARELGKEFIAVRSNVQQVCLKLRLSWNYVHGPFLCLLAASLGVKRFYIPASYTYADLKPWGSHPLLDPMWSTSATEIIHDGAHMRRSEKTERLSRHPILLGQLQVCWDSQVENCGRCSKCARTLLVLRTLGVDNAPFPASSPKVLMHLVGLSSDLGVSFIRDLIIFFEDQGRHDLSAPLVRRLRRYRLKTALARARRIWFGPAVVARYRRFADRNKVLERVVIIDPDNEV